MKLFLAVLLLTINLASIAQSKKRLDAKLINSLIKVNGILDETDWQSASIASGFIQSSPVAGQNASQKTDVKLLYDNEAIYVSAVLYDVNRDSITTSLSNRDDFGNADYFGVIIDTYGSSTVAFAFIVTSAGVQVDDLWSGDEVDRNWNAVWESSVIVQNDKWIVEMKIPYSALRFPNQDIQNWRINFNRNTRRNREETFWNTNLPANGRFISQLGYLDGIKNIKPPVRLSFSPYISGYLENYKSKTATRFSGGMDLKYGINDAFTIDMTLIPDFGQVKFDDQVLNLSPFEIQYNENRQFFTEGTELFNKGEIFYSRRIGGAPINRYSIEKTKSEILVSNPNTTPLINATKLSGRTKKGLGIGVFNGITNQVNAVIEDTITHKTRSYETSPITNYNVFVLDQNLKNNSSITFTNASTWRAGNTYDANVSTLKTTVFNKNLSYKIDGNYNLSQRYDKEVTFGNSAHIAFHKIAGQFNWGTHYIITDDIYDPNDLGYLNRNNNQKIIAHASYNTYKPFWRFYKTSSEVSFNYSRLYKPNVYTSAQLKAEYNTTFRNFLSAGTWLTFEADKYDYFESKTAGKYYILPQSINTGFYYSSNYAKRFAIDFSPRITIYNSNRIDYKFRFSPRFRFSDKFNTIYAFNLQLNENEKGLAYTNIGTFFNINDNPIFGQRQRQVIENSIEANYIFTNRMGISFKLRHYWAKVEYNQFYTLKNIGVLTPNSYNGLSNDNSSLHNNNYNAFTIDLVYRWVFAPGSQLSLVWKNSIFTSSSFVDYSYIKNTEQLTNSPTTNSLSFKLLYYIDYAKIFKK